MTQNTQIERTWEVLRNVKSLCKRIDQLEQIDEIDRTDTDEAELDYHKNMLEILRDNPRHYE